MNRSSNVMIFCQQGTELAEGVPCYGALRATVEMAKHLALRHEVTLVAEDTKIRNYMGLAVITEEHICKSSPHKPDITIQISRGDRLIADSINVICQHGPHHILGLNKEWLHLVDAVICVSKFSMRQQVEYGMPKRLLHVVANGIDVNSSSEPLLQRNEKTFVYAGHIRGYKGIACLLQAFLRFSAEQPEAGLVLYGENMTWTQADHGFDWLVAMSFLDDSLRIDWIRVQQACPAIDYQGEVTQEELYRAFGTAGFVVCPSVIPETFGLVSLEAQSRGCIPLLANHGGFPETLAPSSPRLFFNPGDDRALAVLMARAISNPVGTKRRERVAHDTKSRSWQKTNSAISILIDRIVKRKRLIKRLRTILSR